MFEVFIKDLMYGTKVEEMELDLFSKIVTQWNQGEDIQINGETIENRYIESIYLRKRQ